MEDILKTFSLVIPTLNGSGVLTNLFKSIKWQTLQPDTVLIIDSSSSDSTVSLAKQYGFNVMTISRTDFDHGGTRQMAVEHLSSDIIVFMTQDVILSNEESLYFLIQCFNDPSVSIAYGRQLPHSHAGLFGAHARLFNYGNTSFQKSIADASQMGIKVTFTSNSFAAYRRNDLLAIGGFPRNIILSEDSYVAANILLRNKKIAYSAEAQVYHSHDYSLFEEFRRYFDTGVFHARAPWIRARFGQAEGEGGRFVLSEMKYLMKNGCFYLVPIGLLKSGIKWLGYLLGLSESKLNIKIKRICSMNKGYWNK